jgi:hypothetical protein
VTIDSKPAVSWESDRTFYLGMAGVMAIAVFVGFPPTYLRRQYVGASWHDLLNVLHGLAFTAWFLLFFTQTLLVSSGRIDLHRKLGVAGAGLAVAMLILGSGVTVGAVRADRPLLGFDPRSFAVMAFIDLLVFAILVAAGITLRNRPQSHKRVMLLATISMSGGAILNLPGMFALGPWAWFGIQDLLVVAGPVYDLASRRRVDPAYVWGGPLILLSQPARMLAAETAPGLAFGDWLKG